jgi:hypothetical protein
MSTSPEPLPSIYRSKQAFLASLPPWRRLLQKLNWRPTIDTCVQIYAIEQELAQMRKHDEQRRKDDARLAELDARFDAIVSRSCSNSTLPPPTPDKPAT